MVFFVEILFLCYNIYFNNNSIVFLYYIFINLVVDSILIDIFDNISRFNIKFPIKKLKTNLFSSLQLLLDCQYIMSLSLVIYYCFDNISKSKSNIYQLINKENYQKAIEYQYLEVIRNANLVRKYDTHIFDFQVKDYNLFKVFDIEIF